MVWVRFAYCNIFIYNEELPYLLSNTLMSNLWFTLIVQPFVYKDCLTWLYLLFICLTFCLQWLLPFVYNDCYLLFTMTVTFCLQWHCLVVRRPVTTFVVTDLHPSWCLHPPVCSDDQPTSQSPPDSTLRASIHQIIHNSVVNRQILSLS